MNPVPTSQLIIQAWSSDRQISKHAGIGFSGHLIRGVGLIAGLAFIILFGILSGVYQGLAKMRESIITTFRPNHVLPAIRQMKATEEADKFTSMQNVPEDIGLPYTSPINGTKRLTRGLKAKLENDAWQKNKGARQILRMMGRQNELNRLWVTAMKDPEVIDTLSFPDAGIAPQAFIEVMHRKYPVLRMDVLTIDWAKVSNKVKKACISSPRLDIEIKKYEDAIAELLKQLAQGGENPALDNPLFIASLRNALSSPIYEAIKEDGSDKSVQLLHRFAVDMWNKAPSMEAYATLGSCIIDQTSLNQANDLKDPVMLAEKLEQSHKEMEKLHYSAHGLSNISYALAHPKQTLGSLASEGGAARHIPGMFGMDIYDSHGTLANNPSLQGVTKIMQGDRQVASVHNCYGGSPTIGDYRISPEMEAAVLAAENNQMSENPDNKIPMMIVYNNLQNLDKAHGEAPRSQTIMLLNQKYPLSFRGTTFAKDSAMYLMKKDSDVVWDNPRGFSDKLRAQLLRSFDPAEKGHGFFFHGSTQKWTPIFDAALSAAVRHFESIPQDIALTPRELQGAFQEYVYTILNTTIELDATQSLSDRGLVDFFIMVITACKENIDRGGMENTKYLFTRLPDTMTPNEWEAFIMGAMHSRALSARDRIILGARLPQILAFMKTNHPTQFNQQMAQAMTQMGYQLSLGEFQPHL